MNSDLVRMLLLGRLIAFMLLVYLAFGLLVEWRSVREGSKLKGFARLLCRPLTAPVARFSEPNTPYVQVLRRTAIVAVAIWAVFVVASEFVIARG